MPGVRRRAAPASLTALVVVAAVCGCSGASVPAAGASDDVAVASQASSSAASASPASGCPSPATVATPTDFPRPAATTVPAPATTPAADADLARQGLALTRALGGPVSSGAFAHYLDASGSYLALPVDDLLAAEPAFTARLGTDLAAAAAAAVVDAVGAPACTAVPFASDWSPWGELTAPDWNYALGHFWYRVLGTATATGAATARVTYQVAVGDTYDFDAGTPFAAFGRLATDGLAAPFPDGGLSTMRTATVAAADALPTPGFSAARARGER